MFKYEYSFTIGRFWSWAAITAVVGLLVFWMMLVYMMVPDAPRTWDFNVLDDTPGGSVFSTHVPSRAENGNPPRQIAPLPEGVPWNPEGESAGGGGGGR
jgi:hypothetical protein